MYHCFVQSGYFHLVQLPRRIFYSNGYRGCMKRNSLELLNILNYKFDQTTLHNPVAINVMFKYKSELQEYYSNEFTLFPLVGDILAPLAI